MKTVRIYPIIQIEVEVPDNYDGTIENDMTLRADFNASTFDIEGAKIGDCELCGWNDADTLFNE